MSSVAVDSVPSFTVLGAGGFLGSHLVRFLRHQGFVCEAPGRDDLSIFLRPLGHVIYAVGLTSDFRYRPLDTVEAHVCLLRRLIAAGTFLTLTYLSSTRVYSGLAETAETAHLRVNPNDPGDLYNLSKLMGESLCLHGGLSGMKVVRLANIVGLRRDPDSFIDQLLDEGIRTGKVLFRTALESKKDYLYIDDAADLITRIALSSQEGIFNVASGKGVSNHEIAQWLASDMGFSVMVEQGAPVWDFARIDMAKTERLFGFVAQPFSSFFPSYLKLYRQQKGI